MAFRLQDEAKQLKGLFRDLVSPRLRQVTGIAEETAGRLEPGVQTRKRNRFVPSVGNLFREGGRL